jgi:copper chaperone
MIELRNEGQRLKGHSMASTVLTVPDISCEHCERAVKNALEPLAGVGSVDVNIPEHLVRVDFDESKVDINAMRAALAEEEYPVSAVDGRAA